MTERVGAYVRYWRAHAGLSVVEASERSGVGRSKWTEIEQAAGPVAKPDTLSKVARAIGRDPHELLVMVGLEPPMPPHDDDTVPSWFAALVERIDAELQRLEGRVRALEQPGDPPPPPSGRRSPRGDVVRLPTSSSASRKP